MAAQAERAGSIPADLMLSLHNEKIRLVLEAYSEPLNRKEQEQAREFCSRSREASTRRWTQLLEGRIGGEAVPPRVLKEDELDDAIAMVENEREILVAQIEARGSELASEGDAEARSITTKHVQRELCVLLGRVTFRELLAALADKGQEGHIRRIRGLMKR